MKKNIFQMTTIPSDDMLELEEVLDTKKKEWKYYLNGRFIHKEKTKLVFCHRMTKGN